LLGELLGNDSTCVGDEEPTLDTIDLACEQVVAGMNYRLGFHSTLNCTDGGESSSTEFETLAQVYVSFDAMLNLEDAEITNITVGVV